MFILKWYLLINVAAVLPESSGKSWIELKVSSVSNSMSFSLFVSVFQIIWSIIRTIPITPWVLILYTIIILINY